MDAKSNKVVDATDDTLMKVRRRSSEDREETIDKFLLN